MKSKSYLFLSFLVLIIVFIIGFRYGQKVEKTNKVVNYLLSITPTAPPTPTPTPWQTVNYKSKKWGLRFIYPSFLDVAEDPTAPAVFFELKKMKENQ